MTTPPDKIYTDDDLIYAATARCLCGAGLAYPEGVVAHGMWDCSAILTGTVIPSGQPGAVEHTARLPFAFWNVKSELQPSARGATTRPGGVPRSISTMTSRPPDRPAVPRYLTKEGVIDDIWTLGRSLGLDGPTVLQPLMNTILIWPEPSSPVEALHV